MAKIKNKQLEFLQGGQENIYFKVFDANGTYLETETENIAKKVPDKIQPLYKDLIKPVSYTHLTLPTNREV